MTALHLCNGDLKDGEMTEMQGSGSKPYVLKNVGGVFSCSCPAWRNQSLPIDRRSCKHLRKLRGEAAEEARIGIALIVPGRKPKEGVTPPSLLLAHKWDFKLDVTRWWMSEKLDGVRALCKGRKFFSKLGNIFQAPEWFTAGLPENALDGELWMGRGRFEDCSSIVKMLNGGERWNDIRFIVFDAPEMTAGFEKRLQASHGLVKNCKYASCLPHFQAQNNDHVREELARIEALGGEGLMLRKPESLYEVGKSMTILKVKSYIDDEAVITGYTNGKGKNLGRAGAFYVKWGDVEFKLGNGISAAALASPPAIGTVIKFKYQTLRSNGVPRDASYLGERED